MFKKIFLKSILLLIIANSEGFCIEYNIDNLLNIAEENSANIQAFNLFAQSQKSFANQQKYWSNPNFSITKSSSQNNLSLSQEIPYFNKLENKFKIENAEFKIQENRSKSLILEVKSQVFKLAYQNFILQNKNAKINYQPAEPEPDGPALRCTCGAPPERWPPLILEPPDIPSLLLCPPWRAFFASSAANILAFASLLSAIA